MRSISSRLVLIVGLLICAQVVNAHPTGRCRTIQWHDGDFNEIRASLYQGTHITLPERQAADPIVGNDLWTIEGKGTHIFIKANSDAAQAGATTFSAIGVSNKSYEFRVTRSRSPDTCVQVRSTNFKLGPGLAAIAGDGEAAGRGSAHPAAVPSSSEALQRYRSQIYTRYKWSGGGGFIGDDVVRDVYDDGRFTFVRLKHDNKGLMEVHGKLNGKETTLERKYDPTTKVYTISGIYPALALRYGDDEIKITRADNYTAGGY